MRAVLLTAVLALAGCKKPGAADAGYQVVEVSLGKPVALVKGLPRAGESARPGLTGPGEVSMRLPSGRVWLGKPMQRVGLTVEGGKVRGVTVDFAGPVPQTLAEAAQRALATADDLGASREELDAQQARLAENPGTSLGKLQPGFSIEPCVTLTTTITGTASGWPVSASFWLAEACLNAPRVVTAELGKPTLEMRGDEGPVKGTRSYDGAAEVTVRLPSGRSWVAKPLHSVMYTANELSTLEQVDVVYEVPLAKTWAEAVERAIGIATELNVEPRHRDAWKEKLLKKPLTGAANRVFPAFPLEGCYALTVTLMVKNDGWLVSASVGAVQPAFWRLHDGWPDTCR